MADTYRISRSQPSCSGCGQAFEEGRRFFSALTEHEGEFARTDYCADCWEKAPKDGIFCHWRTRRAAQARRQVVDSEVMLEFFDRLAGQDAPTKKAFRFVIALYLMRRKEFKLLGVEREGDRELMKFARRTAGDEVMVENPGLDEEQIQEASAQLSELLEAAI